MNGLGSFQDTSGRNSALDAEAVFSAVSLSCERVLTPASIVTALPRAIAAAHAGGPAVLLLPKDIQQGLVDIPGRRSATPNLRPIGDPHPIARALRHACGPVTIVADSHANFLYLPSRGRQWRDELADTVMQVRLYEDVGARITVGRRASTQAVLSTVGKSVVVSEC